MPELSRRSLVRASAGALWVAPVITVATTAPALAVSGEGSVSLVSGSAAASYAQLDMLRVDVDLANTGAATGGAVVQVLLHGRFGPAVAMSSGNPVIGSAQETEGGCLITMPSFVVPGNTTSTMSFDIRLTETMTEPYRGLRGAGADFDKICVIVTFGTEVFTEYVSYLAPWDDAVAFDPSATGTSLGPRQAPNIKLKANELYVAGAHGIGQITLRVYVKKEYAGGVTSTRPTMTDPTPAGAWQVSEYDTPESEADEWIYEFVTQCEGFAGTLRTPATSLAERGPGLFEAELLGLPPEYDGFEPRFVFEAEGFVGAEFPEPITGGGT